MKTLLSHVLTLLLITIHIICIDNKCNTLELPIVLLVTSFNNEPWVKENISSILMQQYSNFRVIYIDDASQDNTFEIAQYNFKKNNKKDIKANFIKNKSRSYKLKNIYNAIHSCNDYEIIVQVDGDDFLSSPYVLQRINQAYQSPTTWITYGQYEITPKDIAKKFKLGTCKPTPQLIIDNNEYRKNKWIYTHIRTFYAWLFKQIKLQDLLATKIRNFEGKFFPYCNDMATFWSMLEMANGRFTYIPEVLYLYNAGNPLAGFRSELEVMKECSKGISTIAAYNPLEKPLCNYLDRFNDSIADVIIVSDGTPEFLQQQIKRVSFLSFSAEQYLILYQAYSKKQYYEYEELCSQLQHRCISLGNGCTYNAESNITSWLKKSKNNHCILLMDNTDLGPINLNQCIKEIEKTGSYALYLGNTSRKKFCKQHLYETIYAWKYRSTQGADKHIHSFDGVLFPTKTLLPLLDTTSRTIFQLKKNFAAHQVKDKNSAGLILDFQVTNAATQAL